MLIIKNKLDTMSSLSTLNDLAKLCEYEDGFKTKLYWHILEDKFKYSFTSVYLGYVNNQLIASLNVHCFSSGIELISLINPLFRGDGVLSKMLSIAIRRLRHLNTIDCFIISNVKNLNLNTVLLNLGGELKHNVIEMRAQNERIPPRENKVKLYIATLKDINNIIDINHACFPEYISDEMKYRIASEIH